MASRKKHRKIRHEVVEAGAFLGGSYFPFCDEILSSRRRPRKSVINKKVKEGSTQEGKEKIYPFFVTLS